MTNMNQNGRSMIEMLGVLAIIGVLSVGGIAGYSKAMLKYKTNKTIEGLTMLVTNIRTLYAQQSTYDSSLATYADIKKLGVVPDEMDSGSALVNPFSGSVAVAASNSNADSGTNRAFVVKLTNLPKETCMAIATSDWGSNYSSGLIAMGIGVDIDDMAGAYATSDCSTSLSTSTTTGYVCAKDMPLGVDVAAKACASASSNTLLFKYY